VSEQLGGPDAATGDGRRGARVEDRKKAPQCLVCSAGDRLGLPSRAATFRRHFFFTAHQPSAGNIPVMSPAIARFAHMLFRAAAMAALAGAMVVLLAPT
jgi:hypothetical protein